MAAAKVFAPLGTADHIFFRWVFALGGQAIGEQKQVVGPVFEVCNGAKGIAQTGA